ncbi:MAG: YggS family pyridoxal phosphate-dependent enzyme [Micromonosporaceae bacterium]
MSTEDRHARLAASLAEIRTRIAGACEAVGRSRQEVTLVAVTKTFPAVDVLALARLGVRDIGENRDQEAAAKAAAVAEKQVEVRWHFVGRLQTNKCKSVARYADVVHSVDRISLVEPLARAVAAHRDHPLHVFAQVSLDQDPSRGGAATSELERIATAITAHSELRLLGVMAVPPLDVDPDSAYRRLVEIASALREKFPEAAALSAGMSGDFESAIRHGATHLRIGSALLGGRPPLG